MSFLLIDHEGKEKDKGFRQNPPLKIRLNKQKTKLPITIIYS